MHRTRREIKIYFYFSACKIVLLERYIGFAPVAPLAPDEPLEPDEPVEPVFPPLAPPAPELVAAVGTACAVHVNVPPVVVVPLLALCVHSTTSLLVVSINQVEPPLGVEVLLLAELLPLLNRGINGAWLLVVLEVWAKATADGIASAAANK
jgi:hypothetical protein